LGECVGDRCRRPAGSRSCGGRRYHVVWKGKRTERLSAQERRCGQIDDGALVHALGPQHQQKERSMRRGRIRRLSRYDAATALLPGRSSAMCLGTRQSMSDACGATRSSCARSSSSAAQRRSKTYCVACRSDGNKSQFEAVQGRDGDVWSTTFVPFGGLKVKT